jgi:hypothetical protein
MAGPFFLLGHAEQTLPSGLTGLLVATVPLFAAGIALARGDRTMLSPVRGAGSGSDSSASESSSRARARRRRSRRALGAIGEVLLVAFLYAVAPFIVATKLARVPSLGTITLSLFCVGIAYLPVAVLTQHEVPTVRSTVSLAALGILCTAVAFLAFFALIGEVGPAARRCSRTSIPSSRSCWASSCSARTSRAGSSSDFPSCSSAAGSRRPAVVCARGRPGAQTRPRSSDPVQRRPERLAEVDAERSADRERDADGGRARECHRAGEQERRILARLHDREETPEDCGAGHHRQDRGDRDGDGRHMQPEGDECPKLPANAPRRSPPRRRTRSPRLR